MFFAASLLALLASSTMGSPVEARNSRITLPMTRRLEFCNSTNLVQHDEARVAALRDYSAHSRRAHIYGLENTHFTYLISVGIGNPPTTYKLMIDTSSAITWVGASTQYVPTVTSFDTGEAIWQEHGSIVLIGTQWTDTVTLAHGVTVTRMPIGVASHPMGVNIDGILGIGPAGLTLDALLNRPRDTFQTITGYLYHQHVIWQPLVGISFQPSTVDTDDGQLSFGETDPGLYTGDLRFTPTTLTFPSSRYWGFDQRITYGPRIILGLTAGIIDSSSTFIWLASDAFDRYRVETGGNLDAATRLLTITPAQYDNLLDLDFHIGLEIYSLTRNAQIWPRPLNYAINGVDGAIYLVVQSIGIPFGGTFDFVLGCVFLQRFYTVLDRAFDRIGFAKTVFTDATTN
ncbi:acid protease [Suillus spraguei]|nr:acid protease [Suillus spraguei]